MNPEKITLYLKKHQWLILALIILIFVACISLLLAIKYLHFGYNALDLAIYNQVFYNTANGRLFQFTIHPHSYLGDHFELFILLLTPFYFLYKSPIMLLILQVVFVALSAWPLYLIARTRFAVHWSLLISAVFLLNPFVLNLLFFEFHVLPFAIPLLLFLMYFYLKNGFTPFCIFLFLSLLVREDVSWIIIMVGFLALIDRKKLKWILVPIIAGTIWFVMAMKLSGYFNHYGSYKFLSMYAWLGNTPREMLIHFITKPLEVIRQIFSFNNGLLVIGLLIPVGGISLLKPRYLVPTILVAGQFFLTTVSTGIVLETHYTSLFLPFIYLAAIFGLDGLRKNSDKKNRLFLFISKEKLLFSIIIACVVIYSFATFSPIIPSVKSVLTSQQTSELAIKNQMLTHVGPTDAVAAGYDYVPFVSGRQDVYSMHYAFRGKKQYSQQPYILPNSTNKLLINFSDFIIYYLQSTENHTQETSYPEGSANVRRLLEDRGFGLEKIIDDQAVFTKGLPSEIKLVEKNVSVPNDAKQINNSPANPISLVAYKTSSAVNDSVLITPLSFFWRANQKIDDDYFLELTVKNNNKIKYSKIYPLDYGLYPTSQWQTGEIVKTNYWFSLPEKNTTSTDNLFLQLIEIKGYLDLDSLRSAVPHYTKKQAVSPAWQIDY